MEKIICRYKKFLEGKLLQMITPGINEDIFEVNSDSSIVFNNDHIIIDNFYKNYDQVYDLCTNMYAPQWKQKVRDRNFIDYYDCRPRINNLYAGEKHAKFIWDMKELIIGSWGLKSPVKFVNGGMYEFSYFKHIQNVPRENMQFRPKRDVPFTAIIHIDKVCSGGTAYYEETEEELSEEMFCDVSKLKKEVIQAKPNRCVIIESNRLHGDYIKNHNQYYDNWRINQLWYFDDFMS